MLLDSHAGWRQAEGKDWGGGEKQPPHNQKWWPSPSEQSEKKRGDEKSEEETTWKQNLIKTETVTNVEQTNRMPLPKNGFVKRNNDFPYPTLAWFKKSER